MASSALFIFCSILLASDVRTDDILQEYLGERSKLLIEEQALMIGGDLLLTPAEKDANKFLMAIKEAEMQEGFVNPATYPPGMHFFKAKPLIEKSKIFEFLKKMPKGGILHGHNTAMVSSEWVLKNLTYYPNLLKCTNKDNVVILTFRKSDSYNCGPYIKVVDERAMAANVNAYDEELEKVFSLYTPQPDIDYQDINAVWTKFENMFTSTGDFLCYLPAFREYHKRLLQESLEDNIMYLEFRTPLFPLYDDDGKIYEEMETVEIMKDIIDDFVKNNPGFFGAKLIYSNFRRVSVADIQAKMDIFIQLYAKYPDFMVGFDLVGQEDLGKPLVEFIDQLKVLPAGAQLFLHAGETNWYGGSTDLNLIDAILLNAKRIGHGYALMKHPIIYKIVKEKNIAIEVSPISNQVLHLVADLRNHPAVYFASQNMPMVICSDDPGFWNAKGLSYDFYYAFMSFGANQVGLEYLKKLVWNSIEYSGLSADERIKAFSFLDKQWTTFLDDIIKSNIQNIIPENIIPENVIPEKKPSFLKTLVKALSWLH